MAQNDEIGKSYYKPLLFTSKVADIATYLAALLSLIVLFIDAHSAPKIFQIAQIVFVLFVIAAFVLGSFSTLFQFPRAEDRRRSQMLSDSFGVDLVHESSDGYYNNNQSLGYSRLLTSIAESSFFTSRIATKMLTVARPEVFLYFLLWIGLVLFRGSDLNWIAVAAQILFSERILSRYLRLELLRFRSEAVLETARKLLLAKQSSNTKTIKVQCLELFGAYETSKAVAQTLLSSSIFEKHNPALSKEWDQIRCSLKL
jgi:hypothetical protein